MPGGGILSPATNKMTLYFPAPPFVVFRLLSLLLAHRPSCSKEPYCGMGRYSLCALAALTVLSGAAQSIKLSADDYYDNLVAGNEPMGKRFLLTAKNARCLDGSPAIYYFLPGQGDGANKWVIYHEGM